MKRILAVTGALLLVAGQAYAQDRPAVTAGTDPDVSVTISNITGSIVVRACERNEVIVYGGRSVARDLDIDVTPKHVKLEMIQGHDLTLCVPRRAKLRARSTSGSVSVSGVEGTVDVESASGSLLIEGRPRTIHAMGFSGDVTINGGGVEVTRAESVSGSVSVSRASGVVDAKSSSGGVTVRGDVREAQLFSVSGTVQFNGSVANGGRLSAESSSGSVGLTLPRNMSADYEMSTISADIENDFGPSATKTRNGVGVTLRFNVGNGGARIKASSVSGSIILKDR
jgi:hypothetical protein